MLPPHGYWLILPIAPTPYLTHTLSHPHPISPTNYLTHTLSHSHPISLTPYLTLTLSHSHPISPTLSHSHLISSHLAQTPYHHVTLLPGTPSACHHIPPDTLLPGHPISLPHYLTLDLSHSTYLIHPISFTLSHSISLTPHLTQTLYHSHPISLTIVVVRLQCTFALDPSEVAAGRILGVPAMESLSRRDRGLLGTTAL